ncbi:transcriptional regulator GcvA [Paraburkholderia acidipaludis]|uniref:transcriptional regulator GcvA n=1 Tax=Paraburkholderia acidipaludis TaxID=660537 RepID=UPI0009FDC8F5|nr:transcriptional regulator GcvA [Paraburkholderia acidipaludis]
MKRVLPPLNALRAFEAAGRLGSFKEAAAELHVTQGAVSQHVRLLEDWLGAPLFERHHRRVALTPAARGYLEEIGPLFGQLAEATARYGTPAAVTRTLTVNAVATFALRWLVPRLAMFLSDHPGVDVRVQTSSESVESLNDAWDVIIRGGPDTFYGYSTRPFLHEERIPVCSPALLKRLPLRRTNDLQRHILLHTASLPRLWPEWLAKADHPALVPASNLTFDHFYLTVQAAIDGVGVAMGPTALIVDDLATGRLVTPFAGPCLPSRSYFMYVPEGRAEDELVQHFCSWLEREGARPTPLTQASEDQAAGLTGLPRSSRRIATPRSRRR